MPHDVKMLCSIARVSRSGYYQWLKTAAGPDKDRDAYCAIKTICERGRRKWGYRTVCMQLNGTMNHKKVLRIMRERGLLATVRRANPYRRLACRSQEQRRSFPNILNRNFTQAHPRTTLCTDITYLPFQNRFAYLSAVKDIATTEIVAAHVSWRSDMNLVLRTMEQLEQDPYISTSALMHSDRGFHYTSPSFGACMQQLHFSQSMSRKGRCIDNAPIESFFGHFKDEIDYRGCRTFDELQQLIEEYIVYYNTKRKQWGLQKMTPVQYRDHLLSKL